MNCFGALLGGMAGGYVVYILVDTGKSGGCVALVDICNIQLYNIHDIYGYMMYGDVYDSLVNTGNVYIEVKT